MEPHWGIVSSSRPWDVIRAISAIVCAHWKRGGCSRLAAMAQGQVSLDGMTNAIAWALEPFIEQFTQHGLGARELFHRNTRRKLKRLGLLEE